LRHHATFSKKGPGFAGDPEKRASHITQLRCQENAGKTVSYLHGRKLTKLLKYLKGGILDHNDGTTTIRVPSEVAKAIEEVATRKGISFLEASKILFQSSELRLLDLVLYTAAYAAVVAEELALRGLDPKTEKDQIIETRRAYRKSAYERISLFKNIFKGNKDA
jgi:hypothetical protein